MKALVVFKNDKSEFVEVNKFYKKDGVNYYDLTLNGLSGLSGLMNYKPGERKLFIGDEVLKLFFTM
jgi:hypothetical protein